MATQAQDFLEIREIERIHGFRLLEVGICAW
jgi:hypothetical protein